jgi:hypothetical protein
MWYSSAPLGNLTRWLSVSEAADTSRRVGQEVTSYASEQILFIASVVFLSIPLISPRQLGTADSTCVSCDDTAAGPLLCGSDCYLYQERSNCVYNAVYVECCDEDGVCVQTYSTKSGACIES